LFGNWVVRSNVDMYLGEIPDMIQPTFATGMNAQNSMLAHLFRIVVRDVRASVALKPIEAEVLLLSDSSPVNIPLRRPLVR
jgi:hypothetical protein